MLSSCASVLWQLANKPDAGRCGPSVITERVCSRIKEADAMDIDAEGEATLNMENDLMMAGTFGEI